MNNTLDHLYETFGAEDVDAAIDFARCVAQHYKPSYFTTYEDFVPHTWVVAALCAINKAANDD